MPMYSNSESNYNYLFFLNLFLQQWKSKYYILLY